MARNGSGGVSGSNASAKAKRTGSIIPPAALTLRALPRPGAGGGPAVRIVLAAPGSTDIDLTRAMTSTVAHSLWQARGGDDAQNWLDAERLLESLFDVQRTSRKSDAPSPLAPEVVDGPLPEASMPLPRRRAPAGA